MSKNNKGSVLNMIEHERHRVAASITHEQEWEHPEPNSGLARMFVIMLLVHVFVIGGIIIYDFVGSDSSSKSGQSSASSSSSKAGSSTTAARATPAALPTIASTADNPPETIAKAKPADVAHAPTTPPSTPLSVPDVAPTARPKAIPFTMELPLPSAEHASPSKGPVVVAKAVTTDPIAFKHDDSETVAPARKVTPTDKPKVEDKPKAATSDETKSVADKPKKVEDKPASFQPKPVATPSAARKALNNDSKPVAMTKKKDESDPPSKKPAKSGSHSGKTYTTTKGDTIYSLARKYKVSEDALMKANNIKKATSLGVGKTLTIPASNK